MRLCVFLVAAVLYATSISAQVNMPQPSPTQTIRQEFGMGRIELTYSRPVLKGRQAFKENSDLAPLGKMWRTGANAATKIKFTDKVEIAGKSIDSGTYVIYTIPNKNEWEVILNKGLTNWGTDGYKETDDVVRIKTPALKNKTDVESFTMQIADVKSESCNLQMLWGNTMVNIPITSNIKDRLRTQIETALKGDKKPFYQAANFYYEWDKDHAKALENINGAIKENEKGFWMYLLKAKIQKELGDKQGAKASAEKCIEVATAAKNDDYVKQAKDFLNKI